MQQKRERLYSVTVMPHFLSAGSAGHHMKLLLKRKQHTELRFVAPQRTIACAFLLSYNKEQAEKRTKKMTVDDARTILSTNQCLPCVEVTSVSQMTRLLLLEPQKTGTEMCENSSQ